MAFSDRIKKYTGENPFSDSQPRNFQIKSVIGVLSNFKLLVVV